MLKNYFKIAWRNFRKNKAFSFINITGLTIGMAACLLILQYVNFELSFDRFHKNTDDIYRVVNDRYRDGTRIQHGTVTYSAVGKALNDDYEEVIGNTRIRPSKEKIIIYEGLKLAESQPLYADHSFLQLFSFPLLVGDAVSALNEPYQVAISESLAGKLTGTEGVNYQELIGKTLFLGRDPSPYTITGIFRNVPENSHLQFQLLISYSTLYNGNGTGGDGKWEEAEHSFTASDFWHYIRLKPGTDPKAVESKLSAFSDRHFQGSKVSGSIEKFYLQPLTKAHLYSDFEYEIGTTGSAAVVWGLLIIALFIIIIAWVNYINLAAAKSLGRAKEVGVRKVAGATGGQLIKQFLAESVLFNCLALVIAVLLVNLLQSSYNDLIGHSFSLFSLFYKGTASYGIITGFILLLIVGTLISGLYPVSMLLSFKPGMILKGKLSASPKGIRLRKAMVVGQFAVTVALITGSFVVYRQMKFMSRQDLGLNIDQVLIVKPPVLTGWDSTYIRKVNSFTHDIKQLAAVKDASTSWQVPGDELNRDFNVRRPGASESQRFTMRILGISEGFTGLYGIKLLAGRNFVTTDFSTNWEDLHHIILNQSSAAMLGFPDPESAVGEKILIQGKQWDVMGVVADFHQKSLHYPVEPTLLIPEYNENSLVSIKVDPENISATIAAVKSRYDTFFPGNLFDHYFLDKKFERQYRNEQLFGKIFGIFSGLAIIIACLGLLGLSLFDTIRRTKEVGVRKVLGASVASIVLLLSRNFVKLILVAILIATPVAWYMMTLWLEGFAYRIQLGWWVFTLAGLLVLAVALLTVSFQSVKAALMNPVKSLKSE